MAATVRTWLVVAAMACALTLALRSADAQETEAQPTSSSSPAQKPNCAPGAATPCRVGALRDPENQEEEGLFNVKVKAPTAAGDSDDSDDDYSDPDQPKDPDQSDDDELVVLGH